MRVAAMALLALCRALRPALRPAVRRQRAALTTMSAAPPRKKVKSIVEVSPDSVIGETVTVKGWARRRADRKHGPFAFVPVRP